MRYLVLAFAIIACGGWWLRADRPAGGPITFEDIADGAGIRFTLHNSATPESHQIETMVSGVAVFDYNSDGRPDIYFVVGATIPGLVKTGPEFHNALCRNNGGGTFTT